MSLSRRSFLGCGGTLVICGTRYVFPAANAHPLILSFLGRIFARSLIQAGARGASRAAVRNALNNGLRRAGRAGLPQSSSLGLAAELNFNLSLPFDVGVGVPVWKRGSSDNQISVSYSIDSSMDKDEDIPIAFVAYDLDSDNFEQARPMKWKASPGSRDGKINLRQPFDQINDGRKQIVAGLHEDFTSIVSIEREPYVISI